jgi:hypothetical protein
MTRRSWSFSSLALPGGGGEDEERLHLVRVEEHLAVELQLAQLGVDQPLAGLVDDADLVLVPHGGELLAPRQQVSDDRLGPRPHAGVGGGLAEAGGEDAAVQGVVLGRVDPTGRRVGEPPVDDGPGQAGVAGLVAEEGHRHRRLDERLPQQRHHLGRGVLQAVEDAQHGGLDVVAAQHPVRLVVAGEAEQVVPLVEVEVQGPGQRPQDRLRRLRAAALLEAGVVVDRHPGEGGDLLPAQPAGAAAGPSGQPDLLGLQRLAPGPQEVGQLVTVHAPSLPARRPRHPGTAGPRLGAPFIRSAGRRTIGP